ncbi:MAG: EF-hand domain-containing protein [Gemmatimonadota bacterium]|nr:EF-hand domain-containing protein [Gemmatimonadota bacterium]
MLTDLQTKKLTRYFQIYDIDDDGQIDEADFERIVENVRTLHGAAESSSAYDLLRAAYSTLWNGLRSSADADGDGGVDLDEWLAYWQIALEDEARYDAEVRQLTDRLLALFDLDEDGEIGAAEFIDFYGVFGIAVQLAETVFVELDADGDGVVTREELLGLSAEFFRGDDPDAPGNLLFGPFGA